ncbi:MAG: hypothetical protein OER85_18500 [Gammaproteobacteria bacterium]|nr:hypothetical protein [Gammaproteobacteria bacterium]
MAATSVSLTGAIISMLGGKSSQPGPDFDGTRKLTDFARLLALATL